MISHSWVTYSKRSLKISHTLDMQTDRAQYYVHVPVRTVLCCTVVPCVLNKQLLDGFVVSLAQRMNGWVGSRPFHAALLHSYHHIYSFRPMPTKVCILWYSTVLESTLGAQKPTWRWVEELKNCLWCEWIFKTVKCGSKKHTLRRSKRANVTTVPDLIFAIVSPGRIIW